MTDVSHYDYEVPRELIAQMPLANRSDARLLVVSRAERSITHAHVRDLPDFLRPTDCIVLNDTRVLPARLAGYRMATGGRWTGLFLSADEQGHWEVLGRTRGRLKAGERIMLVDRTARDAFGLTMVAHAGAGVWIAVPDRADTASDLLDLVGRVPLPPYIRGGRMVERDRERYQTVFARHPGAVAAPTAGLHFTTELLGRLVDAGIAICRVTLHVGIGTFRPLHTARVEDHQMHAEWGEITAANVERIEACRRAGGRVVAIGTTSMRVLETAAREGQLRPWRGETRLYIHPPFQFHAVDALLTNFHWPQSTLLVLVRTFGGDALIQQAYAAAIQQRYRFYSYGDAMFIQ
ncbi:MAG: tRNA preQ1(34) S-adenosylmethionine ribosyltransferase-isomerase QueA [Pirellulaceae bacterium]|jgi:S-adenosylmethionine:tRNA ribosyltransferase-isomerase|nr:tRNA preQ1(34) S-adenosylmethionine ribosyltransferase-isomerase QueA [Pirellulaceae bacterium]